MCFPTCGSGSLRVLMINRRGHKTTNMIGNISAMQNCLYFFPTFAAVLPLKMKQSDNSNSLLIAHRCATQQEEVTSRQGLAEATTKSRRLLTCYLERVKTFWSHQGHETSWPTFRSTGDLKKTPLVMLNPFMHSCQSNQVESFWKAKHQLNLTGVFLIPPPTNRSRNCSQPSNSQTPQNISVAAELYSSSVQDPAATSGCNYVIIFPPMFKWRESLLLISVHM